MQNSLAIALDFPGLEETRSFLDQFDCPLFVKVGMELYYQAGPSVIEEIKSRGHSIFLDLKLHDIPNTVMKAMRGLAGLGADMVNVHAAGGAAMMEAAREGLEAGSRPGSVRPLLIAVTQLTSTSEMQMNMEQRIAGSLKESVLHYAALAHAAGLDGAVCSPHEAEMIHRQCGSGFLTVTPGIRMPESSKDDQKRVASPSEARALGSDIIVAGRAITRSECPAEAYKKMKLAWEGAIC